MADEVHQRALSEATADIFLGVNLSREQHRLTGAPVRVLQVKDIDDGLVAPLRDLAEIALGDGDRYSRYFLRSGDVVVTARGSMLKCALVSEPYVGVLPTSNLIVIRPSEALRPELILALLRHPKTRQKLVRETSGSSVPALKVSSIARLQVLIPPVEKQADLARLIELGEVQYETALEAARLRRDLLLGLVMERLEPAI